MAIKRRLIETHNLVNLHENFVWCNNEHKQKINKISTIRNFSIQVFQVVQVVKVTNRNRLISRTGIDSVTTISELLVFVVSLTL